MLFNLYNLDSPPVRSRKEAEEHMPEWPGEVRIAETWFAGNTVCRLFVWRVEIESLARLLEHAASMKTRLVIDPVSNLDDGLPSIIVQR